MNTQYLTTKETAEHFNVTVKTVYNWEKRGLIPCLRIGRTRRFALSDIEEFEERSRTTGHE